MTQLGNLYFNNLHSVPSTGSHATVSSVAKYESQLKDAYKFFHNILIYSGTNATSNSGASSSSSKVMDVKTPSMYASVGLAMVCAEKGYLQVSKDLFARVCYLLLLWCGSYN